MCSRNRMCISSFNDDFSLLNSLPGGTDVRVRSRGPTLVVHASGPECSRCKESGCACSCGQTQGLSTKWKGASWSQECGFSSWCLTSAMGNSWARGDGEIATKKAGSQTAFCSIPWDRIFGIDAFDRPGASSKCPPIPKAECRHPGRPSPAFASSERGSFVAGKWWA
ncbi:unnamed protein product [Durusdinium trenchii]|uniref:Uncharacterized protein n=2 Tax=Durusdinium trenchii TaxID=1381693 RepID=A0ABP0RTA5_9DINO